MTTIEWVRGDDGSKGLSWNALRARRVAALGDKIVKVSANHCEHVNNACKFCYAEQLNPRLGGLPFKPGHRKDYWFEVDEDKLLEPLRRKKPTRIFVESMSDAFGEWWPTEFIDKLYAVMALTPHHTYINLSKRPERRRQYLDDPKTWDRIGRVMNELAPVYRCKQFSGPPLPNVIEGTSVSNQPEADEFVPILLRTKAALRGLSCEPLLGAIDLMRWLKIAWQCSSCHEFFAGPYKTSCPSCGQLGGWTGSHAFNSRHGRGLDWVIAGGESGRKARPMHPDWVRSLHNQCKAAGVLFFFKQWGSWAPLNNHGDPSNGAPNVPGREHWFDDGIGARFIGKGKAGRLLDGREHNEFPRVAA